MCSTSERETVIDTIIKCDGLQPFIKIFQHRTKVPEVISSTVAVLLDHLERNSYDDPLVPLFVREDFLQELEELFDAYDGCLDPHHTIECINELIDVLVRGSQKAKDFFKGRHMAHKMRRMAEQCASVKEKLEDTVRDLNEIP